MYLYISSLKMLFSRLTMYLWDIGSGGVWPSRRAVTFTRCIQIDDIQLVSVTAPIEA